MTAIIAIGNIDARFMSCYYSRGASFRYGVLEHGCELAHVLLLDEYSRYEYTAR
jgi:hypothetical protein